MPDGASLFMHKYGKTDSTLFCRMKNCIIHRDVNPADDIRNFRNALNDEMRCFSEDKNHRISYRSDLYFRKAIVKGKAFELIAREGEKPILMLFYKSTDMEITGNSCWKKKTVVTMGILAENDICIQPNILRSRKHAIAVASWGPLMHCFE